MSYIEKNIMNGENILYQGNLHWVVFYKAIIWFIISIILYDRTQSLRRRLRSSAKYTRPRLNSVGEVVEKPTEVIVDFRKRLYRSSNNQNIKCFSVAGIS